MVRAGDDEVASRAAMAAKGMRQDWRRDFRQGSRQAEVRYIYCAGGGTVLVVEAISGVSCRPSRGVAARERLRGRRRFERAACARRSG